MSAFQLESPPAATTRRNRRESVKANGRDIASPKNAGAAVASPLASARGSGAASFPALNEDDPFAALASASSTAASRSDAAAASNASPFDLFDPLASAAPAPAPAAAKQQQQRSSHSTAAASAPSPFDMFDVGNALHGSSGSGNTTTRSQQREGEADGDDDDDSGEEDDERRDQVSPVAVAPVAQRGSVFGVAGSGGAGGAGSGGGPHARKTSLSANSHARAFEAAKLRRAASPDNAGEESDDSDVAEDDDDDTEGAAANAEDDAAPGAAAVAGAGKRRARNSAASGSAFTPGAHDIPGFTTKAESSGGAASSPMVSPLRSMNDTRLNVDVLAFMKRGTPFLKYGKSGYPHFRPFQLSEDNCRIEWFSSSKKLKDTQVQLARVDELRLGQTTPIFARHKAPELAKSSFSLLYREEGSSSSSSARLASLDLIAKDPNEFRMWTEGLRALLAVIRDARQGSDSFGGSSSEQAETALRALRTLPLVVSVNPGRRSSVDIVDLDSGRTADVVLAGAEQQRAAAAATGGAARPRALSTSGGKQMHKEVLKSVTALQQQYSKRRQQLRTTAVYYSHPSYDAMQRTLKRVADSLDKIADWFALGDYTLCDDEVWRAGVDLEALASMMKAVKVK